MDWAQRTVKHPGALKKALGAKGRDIPPNTLAKAAKAPGRLCKQAMKNLRTFKRDPLFPTPITSVIIT